MWFRNILRLPKPKVICQQPGKIMSFALAFVVCKEAPALVFIIGTKLLKNSEINCTLAASYFMFSAVNRGLGTCWISFAKFVQDEKIKKKLGLDPDHFIAAPIIIPNFGRIRIALGHGSGFFYR